MCVTKFGNLSSNFFLNSDNPSRAFTNSLFFWRSSNFTSFISKASESKASIIPRALDSSPNSKVSVTFFICIISVYIFILSPNFFYQILIHELRVFQSLCQLKLYHSTHLHLKLHISPIYIMNIQHI